MAICRCCSGVGHSRLCPSSSWWSQGTQLTGQWGSQSAPSTPPWSSSNNRTIHQARDTGWAQVPKHVLTMCSLPYRLASLCLWVQETNPTADSDQKGCQASASTEAREGAGLSKGSAPALALLLQAVWLTSPGAELKIKLSYKLHFFPVNYFCSKNSCYTNPS